LRAQSAENTNERHKSTRTTYEVNDVRNRAVAHIDNRRLGHVLERGSGDLDATVAGDGGGGGGKRARGRHVDARQRNGRLCALRTPQRRGRPHCTVVHTRIKREQFDVERRSPVAAL
jgi:hypothetical protein